MAAPAVIPGPAGYGVRIEDEHGALINEFNGFLGTSTNNVAEYNGLLAALKYAQQHGYRAVRIKSDSELLVKQMRGEYKVKNAGCFRCFSRHARLPRVSSASCTSTSAASTTRMPIAWRTSPWTKARRKEPRTRAEGCGRGPGAEGSMTTATSCGREPLVDTIIRFLAHERVADRSAVRVCVERAIDESGPDALESLSARLLGAGAEWAYYPHDPLARRIHHALAPRVLQPAPVVKGAHHLDAVKDKRLVIFGNHLSYSDANVVEIVLRSAGASWLADRLTAIAGPKVYSNVMRRFSSLCFGTIKVPQSSERSSEDAVMNPRDLARAARRAIPNCPGTAFTR
jgi:ribonuclease HI